MDNLVHEVAIIGSGPAGYTAAIYAARAALKPVVYIGEIDQGGALVKTTEVENYPGFVDGILGPELMDILRKQAERFGAVIVEKFVDEVELTGPVKVLTVDGQPVTARSVIIATGSAYRELGLPDENRLRGRGVSWCATCDGFFFRGKDVVVVGGGDSAMEEATFLTRFANKVTVVHRRGSLKASKIMQARATAHDKIKFVWDSEVVGLKGETNLEGVHIKHRQTGLESTIPASGMFVAIGHDPRSQMFAGQIERDEAGYIRVKEPSTKTNHAGVFACGDVVDHTYRQAVTAAASGCRAALDAEHYLSSLDDAKATHDPVVAAEA